MPYRRSIALHAWGSERRLTIDTVAMAHAAMGRVEGPGRPLEKGRPLAHAYIIRMVAEFQGYCRDLHDLAAGHLVEAAAPPRQLEPLLTTAMTRGRAMDSGNPTRDAMRRDFGRLGLRDPDAKLVLHNPRWDRRRPSSDLSRYDTLIQLRNALAHGNQLQLEELRRQGHKDTVTWGRQRLPVLDRLARSLDKVVWHHLESETGVAPW